MILFLIRYFKFLDKLLLLLPIITIKINDYAQLAHTSMNWMKPSHQCCPGWCANGINIVILQTYSRIC